MIGVVLTVYSTRNGVENKMDHFNKAPHVVFYISRMKNCASFPLFNSAVFIINNNHQHRLPIKSTDLRLEAAGRVCLSEHAQKKAHVHHMVIKTAVVIMVCSPRPSEID